MRLGRRVRRAASLAALALAAGCGIGDGDYFGRVDRAVPGHLRWCNSGEPEYLDPALVTSTTGIPVVEAMFDGLANHGPDAAPVPGLATDWDISADLRRFTFTLRKDAKWSNGRPIVADDFVYHIVRILHPQTASRNAENHWNLKNGQLFTANRVRLVLADSGPFHAGDVVEIVAWEPADAPFPDTNVRRSSAPLALRDQGADASAAYARVPANAEVIVIERRAGMSYVLYPEGDGVYGWVPSAELDIEPNAEVQFRVREVPPEHRPGVTLGPDPALVLREGIVSGRDLLMTPEVLGVRAPDDHTLVLETWGPVPYMVNVISSRSFRPTPREVVSRWPKRWTFPEHIVTSGPFTLDAWADRDFIRLVKSPGYWDSSLPKLERITVYSMNDQGANANYYYQGGCDAVTSNNIPSSYLPVVNGEQRGTPFKDYIGAPYLGSYFYVFNTEVLDNVHLRRALSHAIDRRPLPKILHGGQIPTHQYVPGTPISQLSAADQVLCGVSANTPGVAMIVEPGKLCYVPPTGPTFDVAKAREELALARKEMGAKFPDKITLKFNSGVEGHKLIAEYVQHEWMDKLGLNVELEVQEWKTFLKSTKAGEFQVARMGWIGSYLDPEQNFMKNFKCANPQNRSRWCNAEFDALFARIEAEADRKRRLELLAEAEQLMIDQVPVMPLYDYTQHHLQKPFVRGLKVNLTDRVLFQHASIDASWREGEP